MKKLISMFTVSAMLFGALVSFQSAYAEAGEITTEAELVAAVTNGGVYKVAEGVKTLDCSERQLQVRKNIELDLNGANIIIDNDGFNLQNYEMTITIKNGQITAREAGSTYAVKAMAKTPSVINLEDVVISGAKNGIATANSYSTVNIKGGSISGTAAGILGTMGYYTAEDAEVSGITIANESTLKLTGGKVNGIGNGITANNAASAEITGAEITGNTNNFGIYWAASGALSVTDTKITVDSNGKGVIHANNSTGTITVEDCELTNICSAANKAYLFTSNSGDSAVITVDGGKYTGVNAINASSSTSLTINSGLFSADPSKYVAAGKAAYLNGEGWYEIVEAGDVPTPAPTATPDPDATPTPTQVPTPTSIPTQAPVPAQAQKPEELTVVTTSDELIAAISAKANGIQLGADIDLVDKGIKTTTALYLDLNGHRLTSTTSSVIEVAHSLTLIDTAEEKGAVINMNTSTSYGIKCAAGNTYVIVDGAEVDAASQAILLNGANTYVKLNGAAINGGSYALNMARGSLIIDSAVMNGNADYQGYALYISGGDAVINGGSFNYNGTMSSVVMSGSAAVTINNGTFRNGNLKRGVVNNAKGFSGMLTINGGEFENTYDGVGYSILDSDEGTTTVKPQINISGGVFKDAIGFSKPANTTTVISISGGSFVFDPTDYLAEGCTVEEKDGIYTVTAAEPQDLQEPTITYEDGAVKVVFSDLPGDGVVYVAEYAVNGKLVSAKAKALSEEVIIPFEKTGEITVFIWDAEQTPLYDRVFVLE